MKPLESLRSACATGRDCQTVTVRRGHLRWLLEAYDRACHSQCETCHYRTQHNVCTYLNIYVEPTMSCGFWQAKPDRTHPVSAAGGEGERRK